MIGSFVFDTSALLNIGHRGELEALLEQMRGQYHLLTTPQVCGELTDPHRADYYARLIKKHLKIEVPEHTSIGESELARLSLILDGGEISVIMLASSLKASAVIDEIIARREAKRIGILVTGTLGLLHLGLQQSWLSDGDCLVHLGKMRQGGFSIRRPGANETFAEYFGTFLDTD